MSALKVIRAIGRAFVGDLSGEARVGAIMGACDGASDEDILVAATFLERGAFILKETVRVRRAEHLKEN